MVRSFDTRTELRLEPYDQAFPGVPEAPDGVESTWSFNKETRVLLADFRNVERITPSEKRHLLKMMERDDVSVVSWGLIRPLDVSDSFVENMARQMRKDTPYQKFRRFDMKAERGGSYYRDVGLLTMKLGDFQEYLRLRKERSSKPFEFTEHEQNTVVRFENVDDTVLYLASVEMDRCMPQLNSNYINGFKVSEILPGGEFCMMGSVPRPARPFVGPCLCLSPGGFTPLHQDGHGTVDTGHSCMSGFNEVVMLRRLPEEHKLHAMSYIQPHGQRNKNDSPRESQETDQGIWPTNSTVDEWKRMNYCPSVFILQPGQHLHINKGRLHSFRTLSPDPLAPTDCHARLRRDLIETLRPRPSDFLLLGISFQWMFLGITEKGVEEEMRSCLECAELCRTHEPEPLKYIAIPETALLQIASRLKNPVETDLAPLQGNDIVLPEPLTVCKGILPSLTAAVDREIANYGIESKRASQPDAHECPDISPIDPYGSDYVCRICHAELSNSYYHCMGCEELLAEDMNICLNCYEGAAYYKNISTRSTNSVEANWVSDLNHTGTNDKLSNTRACRCRQGLCKKCGYCKSCSCRCHHHFQHNQRFFTLEQIQEDLDRIRSFVASRQSDSSDAGAFVVELCTTVE